eukprot:gnl/Trimastix_PCT/3060.p1 GENE.gnl/Trimastix_PCT/3060~~gnl/Trimastix_PCT/3060.p1  ORF type:complete len:302 (+),score=32.91 gnl/Trimastix_PCT/3060:34-939(+)
MDLLAKTTKKNNEAILNGTVLSVSTENHIVADNDIPFLIRVSQAVNANSLESKKAKASNINSPTTHRDPFDPPDPALLVGQLPDHMILLNKFQVARNHLLIVTSVFQEQSSDLTLSDITACHDCLAEMPGIVFFNCGPNSGCSQRHKHMQLLPMDAPLDAVITQTVHLPSLSCGEEATHPCQLLAFRSFVHFFWPFEEGFPSSQVLYGRYVAMLECARRWASAHLPESSAPISYNFLLTPKWMLLVPRRLDRYEPEAPEAYPIGLNSLGYSGHIYVKGEETFRQLCRMTPVGLLRYVAYEV